ncbi:MAG: M20 family metallopeptidase [Thermus sp.]|uniref:M20 family metallopeptidase n=1 Tax=unclassified Thermus TaxID=2619321 RepID=UPI0002389AD2|nr:MULTISPECIES: M20 family metallopeptidase [unclassified Thermus]AEV15373.1 Carboxypeptidase G2 [Thermus sp. CCB_US3_UF1]MCS7218585.1 M20 family metallopeptidase [Thermus sp.]MDW8016922.1 M20 family metallopeptidase [Thermus sp.]
METLEWMKARLPEFLRDLEAFVRRESPSGDLKGLEEAAAFLEKAFAPLKGRLSRKDTPAGPILLLKREGEGEPVLVLCHYDTVHPKGSFPEPFRLERDRAVGPGVYDMKGGILALLYALRHAEATGRRLPPLEILFTPDEETGSRESRPLIEAAAKKARAALVLEPPTLEGDLKVARKGVGLYRLKALGKAAHQGVEPEKGVNAILELAHQIPKVAALEDRDKGTTLGPNVLRGGTVSNVVAEEAWVEIDLRAWTLEEARRVEEALRALSPALPGARLELTGGLNRPPMEPTPESLSLFHKAQAIGEALGLALRPGRVGGGSDGNFTAALGVPTLDGLGLLGGDAHQRTEYVVVSEIPRRVALLAELLYAL